MPNMKCSFARLRGVGEGQLQALAKRLSEVNFVKNPGMQVVGIDREFPQVSFELVVRTEREGRRYDDEEGKLIVEKRYDDRVLFCTFDARRELMYTPQGKRELGLFTEVLKQCGSGGGTELIELEVDVVGWTREMLKMYDTAQLGLASFDHFFVEPKMIGKFQAKTVDNQLNLDALTSQPGRIRSIRLSFFYEGTRRTAEVRRDGVLSVSSGAEEDLEHFFGEQLRLVQNFVSVPEGE
ncbi:MAG: hypothetical protein R3F46_05245 [bacterium]